MKVYNYTEICSAIYFKSEDPKIYLDLLESLFHPYLFSIIIYILINIKIVNIKLLF